MMKRNEEWLRRIQKVGRNEGGNRLFLFLLPEDSIGVKMSFESFHAKDLHSSYLLLFPK